MMVSPDGVTSPQRVRASRSTFLGPDYPPLMTSDWFGASPNTERLTPSPWAVPEGVDAVESLDPELIWRPLKERDAKIATVVGRYAP